MAFFYYFLVLCSCQFLRSGAFAAALALARLLAPPANRTHHFYCSFESASRCLHELTPVFSTKYHRCVSAWRTQYLFAITIFSGDVINAKVFKIYMRYTNTCMCVCEEECVCTRICILFVSCGLLHANNESME